jgi:hypothetical protein
MSAQYSLKQITDISYSGINYTIPNDVFTMINYICTQVGSTSISSNVFKKVIPAEGSDSGSLNSGGGFRGNKKRRGNKGMEASGEEWETLRTFQATKIEQKVGIDGDIDQIRLLLNKLTDKTYLDIREKIIDKLNHIFVNTDDVEELNKVALMIYDISSTNKFYSKIFADLYVELVTEYQWLAPVFVEKYGSLIEQYHNIKYYDPETDYDLFCEMNRTNERRKAITTFYLNLAFNGYILKKDIVGILREILSMVTCLVSEPDKKNEVDELTGNIAILYNKEILDAVQGDDVGVYLVNGESITDIITKFAKCKAKDYVSLSTKAIFRFMDLVEM